MITIKTPHEMQQMRVCGKMLAEVMAAVINEVRIGVTTKHLDTIAYCAIRQKGASPSFLGYRGFPASICTSINEEIVHGIPSERLLREGDILSIDIGLLYEGFHTDMARTVAVGNIDPEHQKLIDTTYYSLNEGIDQCVVGNRLGDIGSAIQLFIEQRGFSIVRDYVGHGIGRDLHEDPQIPNYGDRNTGKRLVEGMTIALEPMVNEGTWKTSLKKDGWTVVTKDNKFSAHFEHTILITDNGPEILTSME